MDSTYQRVGKNEFVEKPTDGLLKLSMVLKEDSQESQERR